MVMRQELDEELCRKYPKIFKDRNGDMKETLMCWGFECGDGWYEIINNLCSNIQHHLDWQHKNRETAIAYNQMISDAKAGDWTRFNEWYKGVKIDSREQYKERTLNGEFQDVPDLINQVVAVQIKEKFGTLRFYYNGGDKNISGMVRMAESMSAVTCEECGSPGKQRSGGWIRTLCDHHEAEYQNKQSQYNQNTD
jgi:hypothetical protein